MDEAVGNMEQTETEFLRLKKTTKGWAVTLHKSQGINKGVNTIVETCGGAFGKLMALSALREASTFFGVTNISIEEYV